jgi:C_GCAxxG_C_C family probable redox protein
MKLKTDEAIVSFKAGLNCAQAVLTAFSEDLNFDKDLALNISCGFGGGMGRLQETCGACTGAYMVLGIYNGKKYSDNKDKKEKTYPMVQEFSERFKLIHGAADCKSLLNCEIRTEEGHRIAKENKLFEKLCEKYLSDSITIVEELIKPLN